MVDISEHRRIEKSLRESEARFRALAEASPALIWQMDPHGDVIYVNQRAAELMDMSVDELMSWQVAFDSPSSRCPSLSC